MTIPKYILAWWHHGTRHKSDHAVQVFQTRRIHNRSQQLVQYDNRLDKTQRVKKELITYRYDFTALSGLPFKHEQPPSWTLPRRTRYNGGNSRIQRQTITDDSITLNSS